MTNSNIERITVEDILVIQNARGQELLTVDARKNEVSIRNAAKLIVAGSEVSSSSPSGIQYVDVQLNNDQILNLKASPVELIPAPGEDLILAPLYFTAVIDFAAAYIGDLSAGNLMVEQGNSNTSNDVIDLGAFIGSAQGDAPSVHIRRAYITIEAGASGVTGSFYGNKPLFAINFGADELTGGDPANTVSMRIWYSIVPTVPSGA